MKQKLTKTVIDSLAGRSGGGDFMVFDTEITGFAVRVSAIGAKRFFLQYSRNGKTKRLPLGRYGEITVFEARKKALVAVGELVDGNDPVNARAARIAATAEAEAARKRQVEEDAYTVQKLIDGWKATGLKSAGKVHKAENPRAIAKLLKEYLDLPARQLTQGQAQRALDDLAARAPVMARRTRNYARAAFGWAARRRLIASSPFESVEIEGREKSRDRVLTCSEIGEVWRAAGTLRPPWGAFFKLLLLTLQRRGEVAGMEWNELSADRMTWTVPAWRAKNGKAHIVHLAEPARAALATIKPVDKSRFVFTTNGLVPISGFTRSRGWLETAIMAERGETAKNMPAIDWTLHDFRRTGVTVLAGMGFSVHVADKLLNHVQGSLRGVAAVYQRNEFLPERKRALEAWAAFLLAEGVGARQASNVVSLTG